MIYVVWGSPGAGKSYYATMKAVYAMKKGVKVYSNYPIITPDMRLSSYEWMPELIYEDVRDCMLIIDESYRDFSSRDFKNFTKDKHTFFATNRHNGLDIWIIAQHPARVDLIIREMTNEFILVKPYWLPFIGRPIFFRSLSFLSEKDFTNPNPNLAYIQEYYLFRKWVANSYDTHFYKRQGEPYQGRTWLQKMIDSGELEMDRPETIKDKLYTVLRQLRRDPLWILRRK